MNSRDYDEDEVKELIANFEAAMENGTRIYLDVDQTLDMLDYYLSLMEYDKAVQIVDFGLSLHPNNASLLVERAYLLLDKNDIQGAKRLAYEIEDELEAPNIILLKAEIALNEGNLAQAEDILNELSADEKQTLDVAMNIADLYKIMGYPHHALAWIEPIKQKYIGNYELQKMIADCCSETDERREESLTLYNELIDKDPYNSDLWLELAKTQYALTNFSDSVESCEFALAANQECGEAYAVMAHAYMQLGNYDKTEEYLYKAIEFNGMTEDTGFAFLGLAYFYNEKYDKANEMFEKVTTKFTKRKDCPFDVILPEVYQCYSISLSMTKQFEKAYAICRRCERMFPGNPSVYINSAKIYKEGGDELRKGEALRLGIVMSLNVDDRITIADAMVSLGEYEDALEIYENTISKIPDYPDLHRKIAYVMLLLNDIEGFCLHNSLSPTKISHSDAYAVLRSAQDFDTDVYTLEAFEADLERINRKQSAEE